jgi:hypothetical protein
MTCDERDRQLSDFVDGGLSAAAAAEFAAHLETCARCAGLARDLARLRDAARTLGPIDPPARVWSEIALRQPDTATGAAPAPARRRASAWRTAGLAAAILLTVGTGTYLGLRLWRAPSTMPATGSTPMVADALARAMANYDAAIAELAGAAKAGDSAMDPALAAKLQKNLDVLDRAIADSRSALAGDPDSVPARDSLLDAMQRKVTVLQQTVAVISEIRTGEPADNGTPARK